MKGVRGWSCLARSKAKIDIKDEMKQLFRCAEGKNAKSVNVAYWHCWMIHPLCSGDDKGDLFLDWARWDGPRAVPMTTKSLHISQPCILQYEIITLVTQSVSSSILLTTSLLCNLKRSSFSSSYPRKWKCE